MTVKFRDIPKPIPQRTALPGDQQMGEVRVTVKLTNAFDAVRFELGEIAESDVRQYEADALVDTGAVATVISPEVAHAVGVGIRKQTTAQYADGRQESVGVINPLLIEIAGRDTTEESLVLGEEVLIGQRVLEKTDLLVDCANRCVIPNPAHPDQPVTKVK